MRFDRFTTKLQRAISDAHDIAAGRADARVGPAHLLLALIEQDDGTTSSLLYRCGVFAESLRLALREVLGRVAASGPSVADVPSGIDLERMLSLAEARSVLRGDRYVSTEMFLLVACEDAGEIGRICRAHGMHGPELAQAIEAERDGGRPVCDREAENRRGAVKRYTVDLTERALEGGLDPAIGGDEHIRRVIGILQRRRRNNPLLVGEAGVGKTTIAEAVAQRIADGDVPQGLRDKRVLALDLAGMIAGARYRGELEERARGLLKEIAEARGQIILFIDDLQTLFGPGRSSPMAGLLEAALWRGELHCLAAVTTADYREQVERGATLGRRFQAVMIDEPSPVAAVAMLRGLKGCYEAHHGVQIADEAVIAAVALSDRYLAGRFLPDKAIDLIDEAAARVVVDAGSPAHGAALPMRLPRVDAARIGDLVSRAIGFPLPGRTQGEPERLLQLEVHLRRRVVGQDHAIRRICDVLRRARAGLADSRRPLGSFLFLGPAGAGKTELCKALAAGLFGAERYLCRLDMSEFALAHSVARLIGAPPGYAGHEAAGQLTEAVRRSPHSVILFDQVDMAHPEVRDLLMHMLEDGQLTDRRGRTVDFRNVIIVMTSASAPDASDTAGGDSCSASEQVGRVQGSKHLPPYFVDRIDEVVVFQPLRERDLATIAAMRIDRLRRQMAARGIDVGVTAEGLAELVEARDRSADGARALRRLMRDRVENPLARSILDGAVGPGDTYMITRTARGSAR